jgi:hypothetical protein
LPGAAGGVLPGGGLLGAGGGVVPPLRALLHAVLLTRLEQLGSLQLAHSTAMLCTLARDTLPAEVTAYS